MYFTYTAKFNDEKSSPPFYRIYFMCVKEVRLRELVRH